MGESSRFDVVVVGGGTAGSAVAIALRRQGLSVLVLDRGEERPRRVGETLAGVGTLLLAELDLDREFRAQGHREAYARRAIWGSDEPRERSSVFDRHGPGFHLDRTAFDRWMLSHARLTGATVVAPCRVHDVRAQIARDGDEHRDEMATDGFRVRYQANEGPREVTSRYLVDATGRSAWASRTLGGSRDLSHRLIAVARWFHARDTEPVTFVEATAEGWWYSAATPHDELVAVWMTDVESPTARAGQDDALWRHCLTLAPHTASRLREGLPLGDAEVHPAGPALTRWPSCRNFLAVGDAACAFDPISGEGLCFALRSALEAARVIRSAEGGDSSLFAGYRVGVERVFAQHLAERRAGYGSEPRFAGAPFWQRAQLA